MLKQGSGKYVVVRTIEGTDFLGFVKSFDDEIKKLDIDTGGGAIARIDYNIIQSIKEVDHFKKPKEEIIYADD